MEHYYTKTPNSKLKITKTRAILRNKEIEYYTASGLFSIKKVDNKF